MIFQGRGEVLHESSTFISMNQLVAEVSFQFTKIKMPNICFCHFLLNSLNFVKFKDVFIRHSNLFIYYINTDN